VPLVPVPLLVGTPRRSPLEFTRCTAMTPSYLDSVSRIIAVLGESSSNPASFPDVGTLLHVLPHVPTISADLPTDLSPAQAALPFPAPTA
jgi:hypothetical protein